MKSKRQVYVGVILLALLATACLPEGMRLPQSEFLAAVERKAGMIAYLGTDGNIYTIDQGGGEPTPVTSDAHFDDEYLIYGMPVWSPNGKLLTFAGFSGKPDQQLPEKAGLYVANKEGSSLTEVYSSDAYLIYYYWSPDSARVSFLSDTPNQNLALKLVSSGGGDAQTIDVGSPYYWTWAPDSHSLLIHAGGATAASQERLAFLQVDGAVVEHGLDIRPTLFKAPAYSPDGRRVLVAGETADGKSALLLTDATGLAPQTIAEYSGNIAFAWSPDGRRVAYISSDTPSLGLEGALTVVDPSGKQKPVTLADAVVNAFFWSPNGKELAYFSTRLIEAPTPEPGSGQSSSTPESFTVWNVSVMDAANGKTHSVATFLPTERFLELLPYFDQYHQSATIWSPDSKNLVVSAYTGDGDPGIWVVAASGALEPRFIAPGWVGFWSWK